MINLRTAAFVGLAAAALTAASSASASAGTPAEFDQQAAAVCFETGGGEYQKVQFAIQGYPAFVNCISGPDIRVTPMPAGAYCTIMGMPPVVGEADGTGACRARG
ncbi:hypothetical protein HLB23_25065 [Nocardia uniformis]|uniref:Uncharacterized protein n=1 Tax=Nocardia uniformis TaxID=53432 RepID=A0A849C344_9NOCA|nr:hypothetical protein [Nocardia uniformis]NNH73092.1 hypothetical protein [Nocardia uniformis]